MSDLLYEGSQAAPASATVVVQSAALPAGQYSVLVSVHLEGSGTPATADLDNLALYSGATEIGQVAVPEAKAVLFTSPEVVIDVAASGVVSLQAVGNATTAVTYAAVMRLRALKLYAGA